MANAQKIANIFDLASTAFGKLAELTLDLKIFQAQAEQTHSTSSRWTIIEMEQLKEAIARFGNDLAKIASVIETKTLTQIKHKLKSQALDGPGTGPPEVENEEEKEVAEESGEDEMGHVQELAPVSTVSVGVFFFSNCLGYQVDRGRRKQTFSERSEQSFPDSKKRRIEDIAPSPVTTIPKLGAPLITRQVMPVGAAQRLPTPAQSSTVSQPRIISAPVGPKVVTHAQMRKQPMLTQESKYEEYSDVSIFAMVILSF
uniref:SANT domain-containing protein n=1 Tax=Mesocestoides corti TaxID=53468 RepID=A0A5K3EPM6_MESCO